MTDRKDLFPTLEPPPGGLERLRRKLDRDDEKTSRAWAGLRWATVGLGATAAALLIVLLPGPDIEVPPPPTPSPCGALCRDLVAASPSSALAYDRDIPAAAPLELLPGTEGSQAALRVPLADDRVVFYWVEPERLTPDE